MEFTAIILAGGKSSRMGQDKGLMLLENKPMIRYVLQTVSSLTKNVMIIANDERYHTFGFPVYPDIYPNQGPLGGVLTGLRNSQTEFNLVLSCDVPYVTPEVLQYLISQAEQSSVTVLQAHERLHPLIGFYATSIIPLMENQVRKNELSMSGFIRLSNARILNADRFDPRNFRNLNSPEDL